MNSMNWQVLHPEMLLLAMTGVIAIVDLFATDARRRLTFWLSQVTLLAVAALHLEAMIDGQSLFGMQGMVVADPMGHLLAFFATVSVIATLAYAQPYVGSREMQKGEFYTLSLFSLLGACVMVSANNFLVIYLGLELMSLSMYALTALRRDHAQSTEAAMKYFVLGALASGFLLYGLSMMYGATGSLDIQRVFEVIGKGQANQQVLVFGLVFIVSGLAFKFGAAPFHMWLPDVYHGAPTAVTLLIASVSKLAAFGIAMRLLVEGLLGLANDWQQMLIVLALASLVIGNFAAIAQTNLKRLLAYSAIGQVGFMLLALAAGVVSGNTLSGANAYSSALFYMVTYVMTTLGAFGVVMLLTRQGFESEEISDLAGLNQRSPWMAAVMALFMFSLAGVPPLVGFYAKLSVLQALVTTNLALHLWLAVAAVLLSLVGAFYYLRIVKVMYFDEPAADAHRINGERGVQALLAVNGGAVLVFGLLPGGLMAMCSTAIVRALAT
ncbi:MAG: NADH-quinone oxidoreductase subunit NuoN [Burkholderiaceae bacterium]